MSHLDNDGRSYPLLEILMLTAELRKKKDYEAIVEIVTRCCAQTETEVK